MTSDMHEHAQKALSRLMAKMDAQGHDHMLSLLPKGYLVLVARGSAAEHVYRLLTEDGIRQAELEEVRTDQKEN